VEVTDVLQQPAINEAANNKPININL